MHVRVVFPHVAATLVLLIGCFASAAAAENAARTIVVPMLAQPPTITGAIDDSWAKAARVTLDGDYTNRRAAEEATTVLVAQDKDAVDIAYVATQREAITAVQQTNGAGVASDDYVGVDLFPNGTQGFAYSFLATPNGTRYQTSSENSAYTPQWQAVGKRTADGYVVTTRIPLGIMRSGGSTTWRAQLVRATVAANALALWSYDPAAANASDPTFAGTFATLGLNGTANRPKPRAQVYGLGERTAPAYGGDTSRVGADLSLPITSEASLVATFHPDFSNVEIDQQTIAPTAFARQYSEVRPFFTQVGSSFNALEVCISCVQTLYTPAIPTFRDGYAVEGTQGPLTFAAFDAVGYSRADSAETVNFNTSNTARQYAVAVQRVAVDGVGGLHDDAVSIDGGYTNNRSHEVYFANYANEQGSAIANRSLATSLSTGGGFVDATTVGLLFYNRIGPQFAPQDGYVQQNDVNGPGLVADKTFPFAPHKLLHDIAFSSTYTDFTNRAGQPAQHRAYESLTFDFRDLLTLRVTGNALNVRTYDGRFVPFDGNGLYLGYRVNTTTPSYVSYTNGDYFNGTLDSWTYLTTIPFTKKVHLTLEADEDNYLSHLPSEGRAVTWLERATFDFQIDHETSFDIGARRIFGEGIPNAIAAPDFTPYRASNVTVALHYLSRDNKSELYAVYGDPNALATKPALYLKFIRYIGAAKGT